eukprot:jgi/Botrbrau1/21691/Bobra.43_1s0087.1
MTEAPGLAQLPEDDEENGLSDGAAPFCSPSMQAGEEEGDVLDRGLGGTSGDAGKGKGKARKPYVVSRPREKWSESEHDLFVEALRLYGRSWKSIEAHIGSKTAVQIRSHAQKHFQKLQREQISRDDGPSEDIPPPRPKRRPSHPYPRKGIESESGDLQPWGSGLPVLDDQAVSLLKDANANQVAECASAAAAAAAFAVINAAGENVQMQFQKAPPTCFPFYGLTPTALLHIAMQSPLNPAQINQLSGPFNQHSLNMFQHAALHQQAQMLGGHVLHQSHHQSHRKHHHHHSMKHHGSKDTGGVRVHRPLARPANAGDQTLDPVAIALAGTMGGLLDGREDVEAVGLPDINNGASTDVLPYLPAMSGDQEQTATSDQLRKRRPAVVPRPARSDGDSAISGEHSDGREGFNHLGDTGATSQDRTAGKVGLPECGPSGWQQAAPPWPLWHLSAVPMQPLWHMMPPQPQYAPEEWRTLILAAAQHASQQEIARFAQVAMGPGGMGPPQGCSTGARTSTDKSPSPSAVARMERSLKIQAQRAQRQRERAAGLSLSGAGSGRRSASDIKQDEENSPISGIDETNTNLTVGPSPCFSGRAQGIAVQLFCPDPLLLACHRSPIRVRGYVVCSCTYCGPLDVGAIGKAFGKPTLIQLRRFVFSDAEDHCNWLPFGPASGLLGCGFSYWKRMCSRSARHPLSCAFGRDGKMWKAFAVSSRHIIFGKQLTSGNLGRSGAQQPGLPKVPGQAAVRGKARNTFCGSEQAEGSGEGSREGSREGSGSGEGSNPTGNGNSGANNASGNNNSGSGEAVRHSGRGSNNKANSGSGNGDSGSADHTHPHRMEAAAELANAGQSKAPANAPHSGHGGRLGVNPEGGGTGSDESGADMAKTSKGNSSGQGSGRAPTGIPSLGPNPMGPTVGMPQGHPGLANWYMNSSQGIHEPLLQQQVQGMVSWPGPMSNMPLDIMQRLLGFFPTPQVPHGHFHPSPLVPSTDTTTSGNVTGQGFQPYKAPRSGTAHASRVGPACPSSGALSVASKRTVVHQVHPSASEIAHPPKKRLHASLSGGYLSAEGLPVRKRSHTAGTISLPGPESSSGVLFSGLRRGQAPAAPADAATLPENP